MSRLERINQSPIDRLIGEFDTALRAIAVVPITHDQYLGPILKMTQVKSKHLLQTLI